MNSQLSPSFNISEQLEKTVVTSLVTSFGLDFLLFEDKKGGDVDTILNVRKHFAGEADIHVSENIKDKVKNNPVYNSSDYHSHANYKNKGRADKTLQNNAQLNDSYRNQTMGLNENRQLDHIISASEVHNDPGRILAELNGSELANQNGNFQSTHGYINNLKSNHSMDDFLNNVVPKTIETKTQTIAKDKQKLATMPTDTAEQRDKRRKQEDKIRKDEEHLATLKSIDHDGMKKADEQARKEYNAKINYEYYTSSKFLTNTAKQAGLSGLKMGLRQALGLVLAEFWFAFREHMPSFFNENGEFSFTHFFQQCSQAVKGAFERIKSRCKEILDQFKDGILSGLLSSVSTTIMNIFVTSTKTIGKLIRELWSSLVTCVKMIFFNPQKLSKADLVKEVMRVLLTGVSVAAGAILNQYLSSVMLFPLGTELAAFISALASGILTLGFSYFLDHSKMMRKVWDFLAKFKSQAELTLEYFQNVNVELDRYLSELARIEFNLNVNELENFTCQLLSATDECERHIVINKEIVKRNIELPFELGNASSTRSWLENL